LLHTQLEKAKKREAAFIVTFAKREQEIAELKVPHLKLHFADAYPLDLWNIFNLFVFIIYTAQITMATSWKLIIKINLF
jgi:hypothetical protein